MALSDDAVGEGAHWEVDWRGSVALLGPTTPTTALEPVWGGPPQRAGGTDENGPSEDDLAFREVGDLCQMWSVEGGKASWMQILKNRNFFQLTYVRVSGRTWWPCQT